nr:MAG TPA: hypothetical protein [Caudoviricetes sp.]
MLTVCSHIGHIVHKLDIYCSYGKPFGRPNSKLIKQNGEH